MTVNLPLAILAGALVGVGVTMMLSRVATRTLLGFLLCSNGVGVLLLVSGGPGASPPMVVEGAPANYSDPLPQAMILTSIVLTLAMCAFVLAMIHRWWHQHKHLPSVETDFIHDDLEDKRLEEQAERRQVDLSDDASPQEPPIASDFAPASARDVNATPGPVGKRRGTL